MPQVVKSLVRSLGGSASSIPGFFLSYTVWTFSMLLLISPICFYRRLNSLSFAGYLNMFAVAYLLVIMLVYMMLPSFEPARGEIRAFVWSWDAIRTLPILVFAYTCAQNIMPVYHELHDSTVKRSSIVSFVSVSLSALVYLIVGFVGYSTFGTNVEDNIIAMYPDHNLFVCLGKLSVVCLTLTSYPMQLHPSRASIYNLLAHIRVHPDPATLPQEQLSLLDEERRPPRLIHAEITTLHWNAVTVLMMLSGVTVALLIQDLTLVLGLVGSIGSTTISFIVRMANAVADTRYPHSYIGALHRAH